MKQHDISDDSKTETQQNNEEIDESKPGPPRAIFPIPVQDESFVSEEFARYLTPEFTQQLVEHMFRAKKAALREAQENP